MTNNKKLTDEQVMDALTACVKGLLAMPSDNYEQCKLILNAVAKENGSEGIAAFTLLMYEIADMLRPLAIEMNA